MVNRETLEQSLYRDVHDIANSCDCNDRLEIEDWVEHIKATLSVYKEGPAKCQKQDTGLREKIASLIGADYHDDRDWNEYSEHAKNIFRTLADKILVLTEERK